MEIVAGNYRTIFADNMWKTYFKNNLISATNESMWNYDSPFTSQRTGELLLQTTMEVTASLEPIMSAMEITDSGDVKDIPTPSEKIQDNQPEETILILTIQAKLNDAFHIKKAGKDVSHIMKEVENLQNKYKQLQKQALLKEYDALMVQAELDLKNDIDCTILLNRAEDIMKYLK